MFRVETAPRVQKLAHTDPDLPVDELVHVTDGGAEIAGEGSEGKATDVL